MTQFQFDPDGTVRLLQRTEAPAKASVTSSPQYQPPSFSPVMTTGSALSPTAPGSEAAAATATAVGTAASVTARKSIPMLVGAIEYTLGSLAETAMEYGMGGMGIGTPYSGAFRAAVESQPGMESLSYSQKASSLLDDISRSDQVSAVGRTIADITNFGIKAASVYKEEGLETMNSYIGFSPNDDRYVTMDQETYFREVLEDPFLIDPGRKAGLFIGNALASTVPSMAALVAPQMSPAILAGMFAQGYAGAASQYERDQKSKGLAPDASTAILMGIGGGTIEYVSERINLDVMLKAMKAFRPAANARLGRAIVDEASGAAKPGAIRRAANAISEAVGPKVTSTAKVLFSNALEESAAEFGNNLLEMAVYDPSAPGKSIWGTMVNFASRTMSGVGEAGLSGLVGGSPFAAVAGLSAGGRDAERLQARAEADRIRRAMPDVARPIPEDQFVAEEAAPAAVEEAEAPDALTGPIQSPDVSGVFDTKDKDRQTQSLRNARATGEAPLKGDLTDSADAFESREYANEIVDAHPEFALGLIRAAERNGGVLPRSLMPLVYKGTKGKGKKVDPLDTAARANFINNLKAAVGKAKTTRKPSEMSDAGLRKELKEIGDRIKNRTATDADYARAEKLQKQINKRAAARDKKAEEAKESLAVDREIAEETADVVEEEVGVEEAAEEAAVTAPAPARPTEAEPEVVVDDLEATPEEDLAEPAAAEQPTVQMSESLAAEIEEAQSALDQFESAAFDIDPDDQDALDAREEEQAELQSRLDSLIERAEQEASRLADEAAPEPEAEAAPKPKRTRKKKAEEAPKEEAKAEPSDAVRVLLDRAKSLEDRLADVDKKIAAITTKKGNPKRGKKEEREKLVKARDLLAKAVTKAKADAKTRQTKEEVDAKQRAETKAAAAERSKPRPSAPPAPLGVSRGAPGPLGRMAERLGAIVKASGGKRVDQLSDVALVNAAVKELGMTKGEAKATPSENLVEQIIERRLRSIGIEPDQIVLVESFAKGERTTLASNPVIQIITAPPQRGEGNKSYREIVERRLAKAGLPVNAGQAIEQGLGRATAIPSSKAVAEENKRLEAKARGIWAKAAAAVSKKFGVDITDPNTRQKVGLSDIPEVAIEQIENWSDNWVGETVDSRDQIVKVFQSARARAQKVLDQRQEVRETKPLKTKGISQEEAAKIIEERNKARRDRLEAAQQAVNPDGIGVLVPPLIARPSTAPQAEFRVTPVSDEQARREEAARQRRDIRERDPKPDVNKMKKQQLIDEVAGIMFPTEPDRGKARRAAVNQMREAGLPVEKAGGVKLLRQRVTELREQQERGSRPVNLGKAGPLDPARRRLKAEQRQRAEERVNVFRAIKEASERRKAEAAAAAKERHESEGLQTRASRSDLGTMLAKALKSLEVWGDAGNFHVDRVKERLKRFEYGDIIGRAQIGKMGRKAGRKQFWGAGQRFNLATDAPRLHAAIEANMTPGVPNEFAGDSLSAIDAQFGTNFAERFDEQGPEGLAVREDIQRLLNDAAMAGANREVAGAMRVDVENGNVIFNVKTRMFEAVETASGIVDRVDEISQDPKSVQELEADIAKRDKDQEELASDLRRIQRESGLSAEELGIPKDIDAELDNDVAFSTGEAASIVIPIEEGGAAIVEEATRWAAVKNYVARITEKVGDIDFIKWLSGRVQAVENARNGQQMSLEDADNEINKVIRSSRGQAEGLKRGDLAAVPDSEANSAELSVVRAMRRRGRRVVLYRAQSSNGIRFNGFVSSDPNTIFIRVGSLGPNVFSDIKSRRDRRLIEAEYRRIMLQLVRHENTHLIERDPGSEEFRILADVALNVATGQSYGDAFNDPEVATQYAIEVLGLSEEAAVELAATSQGRKVIVSELRAEASSQIDALRRAGGESLYTEANIIKRTMDRVRRAMTTLGLRGRNASAALAIAEYEVKMNIVESTRRVANATTPQQRRVLFSTDMDVDGVPIFDYSSPEPLFSVIPADAGERFLNAREAWQDRNIRLRKATQDLESAYGPLPDDINPMLLVDIAPGLLARKSQVFMQDEFKPLFREMAEDNISMEEMGMYLHAKHAEEANRYLRENKGDERDSGMTDNQASDIIQRVEQRSDAAKFMAYAERLQKMARETLEMQREAGLITQDDYERILAQYKFYVPLADPSHDKTLEFEDEPVAGLAQIGRAMFFRKGRDKVEGNIIDQLEPNEQKAFFEGILVHIGTQRARVIRKSIRNQGLNRMLGLAESLTGSDRAFVAELGPRRKDGSLDREALQRMPDGDSAMVVRLNRDMVLFGKPFRKGEQVVLRAKDKRIGQIMNTNGARLEDYLSRHFAFVAGFTRMKRALATRYNIEFTLVNPVRDVMEASSTLRALGYDKVRRRLAAKAIPALGTAMKYAFNGKTQSDNPEYQQYLDAGSQQNFYRAQDATDLYSDIAREARRVQRKGQKGISWEKVKDNPLFIRQVGSFMDNLTNALDDGIRYASWQIAREEGLTVEQATALSRDVTVDFSRQGNSWGAMSNQIFAFSNVSFQGIEKLARKRKRPRVFGDAIGLGVMVSMLNSLAFDDEEWDAIPSYIKNGNFIIPLFRGENGEMQYLKVPKPIGIGAFATMGEKIGEFMFRSSKRNMASSIDAMLSVGNDLFSLNPYASNIFAEKDTPADERLGFLRKTTLIQAFAPDIADPLVSSITGYDWAGRPLFPRSYRDDDIMSEKGFRNTPEAYKSTARLVSDITGGAPGVRPGHVDFSPEAYRFLANELFFGPARTINRIVRMVDDTIAGNATEWRDIPVARRFVDQVSYEARDREAYYDFDRELSLAKKANDIFEEEGLATMQEAMARFEMSEEEVRRASRMIALADDPEIKRARGLITRKLKAPEEKARAEGDYETLRELEELRRSAYRYVSKRYREEIGD